jgi:S-DNA-T family DNA segregation ATPase FtsK/SpoIIIE
MPAMRSSVTWSFLPDEFRAGVRRRILEIGGLALIVLAFVVTIALASWSVQDPSLSHATAAPAPLPPTF